jgi:TetR/AcrR family transcriptional regulator
MPRLSKTRKALLTTMMRESIFEAATSVLCEHGVQGTTMNRVAEAANLTKSNLYNYFQDKKELLEFFNTRLVEPCLHATEEIVQSDLLAPQKLEKILRTVWDYCVKHKGLIRLLRGTDQDSEIRRNTRPRVLKMLTAVFERGIQEGSFHPHNPAHMGRMLSGSLSELVELQAEGASSAETNDYVEALVNAVVNGIVIRVKRLPEAGTTSPSASTSEPS